MGAAAELYFQIMSLDPGSVLIENIKKTIGTARGNYYWNRRKMQDSGICLSGATDLPLLVTSVPESIFYSCGGYMDGLDQPFQTQNTLTVAELLKAWTIGGQKNLGMEQKLGTLEAGKLADITVFDRNLLQTETREAREAGVVMTMMDGRIVYTKALFGLGGSTFGMSDELVPFYLLIMPIMFAMGYDSMTTFMTVCLAATVGYAASTINPFSVLIAQGVAGIQGNPQLVFRMVQWVIMMTVVITFVTWRALKIKKSPEKSITYRDDLIKKQELSADVDFSQEMTVRQKLVVAVFVCGMVMVVVGLVKSGWYMNELSACFFGMGILMGIAGGLNEKEIAEEFLNGVKDIAFAAMVIGFCSGIMVVAQEGMIIDTILNALSGLVANSNNVMFAGVLYVVQSLLTLLVPSSSGLAALSIPVMAPLCDLHGVNPEAAVTALQYANQLTNLMSPVAGTTVAGLAICRISFGQWWKTIWKVFLLLTVIAMIFCTISAGM